MKKRNLQKEFEDSVKNPEYGNGWYLQQAVELQRIYNLQKQEDEILDLQIKNKKLELEILEQKKESILYKRVSKYVSE